MKTFTRNFFLKIIFPFLGILLLLYLWDPFRVFFKYDDYYTNYKVYGNRETVCLNSFDKKQNKKEVENFVIGSSRSHAYKIENWIKHINVEKNKSFHYDAARLGLYRTVNALNYLSENTNSIKNVLFVIDYEFLDERSNPNSMIAIQPPKVSKESYAKFSFVMLKETLNLEFLNKYLMWKLFGKYELLITEKYDYLADYETGDLWYGHDRSIDEDSNAYYGQRIAWGIFYDRPLKEAVHSRQINDGQLNLLKELASVFKAEKTNIKVVISPLYDQLKINPQDVAVLKTLFGAKNVFDFSGKNDITEHISNYYEESHYKPYIANMIMDSIYKKAIVP